MRTFMYGAVWSDEGLRGEKAAVSYGRGRQSKMSATIAMLNDAILKDIPSKLCRNRRTDMPAMTR